MKTTGAFSSHLDTKMGLGFEDLEHLSIREQREMVTNRAKQMRNKLRLKHKYENRGGNYNSISQRQNEGHSLDAMLAPGYPAQFGPNLSTQQMFHTN